MKSRLLALLLILALLPAAPSAALAQTGDAAQPAADADTQDWQGLKDLKPGKKIVVEFKPNIGDPVEARFVSAVGTKLTITSHGFTRSLEQRDIQSVYQHKGGWKRKTTAKIGMVVGALVGAYIDSRFINPIDRPVTPTDDGTPSMAGLFYGGAIGAGVGALLGGRRNGRLLYEAK
ncbi:MAG TPA: hypothetical protein VN256_20135 [Pyrinomonadaceae bacterium]|nr:hypothetical protein [Pyrinomonadaceae bacterium]